MPVDAGGYPSIGIDLDGSLRNEAQFISKYREMAMQPEIEQAVEDIQRSRKHKRKRFLWVISRHTKLSDAQKSLSKEFNYIMRLLDFNNRGEIFRRWYVDGKGYYHMIVNPNQPRRGIIEMRPIDLKN